MKSTKRVLNDIIDYLVGSISELNSMNRSDFNDGELLAYIDCLEILSSCHGFKKYGIADIEKYFNVR